MAEPIKTKQELLDEARTARHELMTGTLAQVVVDQNGERVEYNRANLRALERYIAEMERSIASSRGHSFGPLRVYM